MQVNDILEFQGEHRWLSNFWPCSVELDGLVFSSVEAAYVAAKTTDIETRKKIQSLSTAGECKRFGRTIKLREDWEAVKLDVMYKLLVQKFNNKELARKLLDTGDCHIQEGNKWNDRFWGVCKGQGENHLGKLIMKIRSELHDAYKT